MQFNRLSYFAISTEKEQPVDNLKFYRTLNTAIYGWQELIIPTIPVNYSVQKSSNPCLMKTSNQFTTENYVMTTHFMARIDFVAV